MAKIRVALAVAENGHWCASGGGGNEADENMELCRENCRICGTGSIACFWVEMEVPDVAPTATLQAAVEQRLTKPCTCAVQKVACPGAESLPRGWHCMRTRETGSGENPLP